MKKHLVTLSIVAFASATAFPSGKMGQTYFPSSETNATKALQAAIDAGARTVVLDAGRGDWCIEPIKLRSNLELVFGENVRVRAVPGAFRGKYDMMFRGQNVTNVTIRGMPGARVSMLKRDYLDAERYKWSEWRHMFAFYDSANISIENLDFTSSGGDGVYIARCSNVRLENLSCVGHDRQGISVIAAENLQVRRCRFSFNEGTPPQCGIDFEPNSAKEYFVSCVVEQCEFEGNFSHGALFHIPHLNSGSRPLSVAFRDCRFVGNGRCGVGVYATWFGDHSVRGFLDFERCAFVGNAKGGISLAAMPPEGLSVNFRDCVIDCRGSSESPIVFNNGSSPFDFGGVSFRNVRVLCDGAEAIEFCGMTGVGITNVEGVVAVVSPAGERKLSLPEFAAAHPSDPAARAFKPATVYARRLAARHPDAQPASDVPVFCRGRQLFLQKVPAAGKRTIKFVTRKALGAKGGHPVEVKVDITDREGTPVDSFVVTEAEREYVLESARDNIYLFTVNSRVNECAVVSPFPGHGIRADTQVRVCAGGGRDLWFVVPAASRNVALEFMATRVNPLSAKIIDGAGEVRATIDKAKEGRIVKIDRKPTAESEVWRIAISECGGQGFFDLRIGGNVVAVVSDVSEACLKQD